MSWASKAILTACCATSLGIISFVHWKQQYDRDQLHMGVVRDVERQQRRKAENMYRLQQQIDLTEEFKKNNPDYLETT